MDFTRTSFSHSLIEPAIVSYDRPAIQSIVTAISAIGRRYHNEQAARPLITMIRRFCTDMVVRPYVSTLEYRPTPERLDYITIEIEEYAITVIDGTAEYSGDGTLTDTIHWDFTLLRNGQTFGTFHWDEDHIARLISQGASIKNTTMSDSYFVYDQMFHTQDRVAPPARFPNSLQPAPLADRQVLDDLKLAIHAVPEEFTARLEQHRNRRIKSFVQQQLQNFGTDKSIPQFSLIMTRYLEKRPATLTTTYECLTFACASSAITVTESELICGNGHTAINHNWTFTLMANGDTWGDFQLDHNKFFDYAEDNGRLHLEMPAFT